MDHHRKRLMSICRTCNGKIKLDRKYLHPKSVIDYKDEIIKLFDYSVEKDISGIHPPYLCSYCRRKLDHCSAALAKNVNLCAEEIVPCKEHSNYCDVCDSKRRNIYNFSVNAVTPALVSIKNFNDFLLTTAKQYGFHQLILDKSAKIVTLRKPVNSKNIAVIKLSVQVLNDQTWNLYMFTKGWFLHHFHSISIK